MVEMLRHAALWVGGMARAIYLIKKGIDKL
jgi:hypothetical protein